MRGIDIITAIGLLFLAVMDAKNRKVSVSFMIIFSSILFIFRVWEGVTLVEFLLGFLPGAALLILAVCSRENVGIGDGLVVCALGMGYELEEVVGILGSSLFLTAIVSIGLLITKRVNRKTELPWIPYLFVGYFFVIWIR